MNLDTEAQRDDLLTLIHSASQSVVNGATPESVHRLTALAHLAAAVQSATSTEKTDEAAANLAASTAVIQEAATAAVRADRAARRKADRKRTAVLATPADAPA